MYTDAQGYSIRCGFDRKENLYVAALKDNSLFEDGQVLVGSSTTAIPCIAWLPKLGLFGVNFANSVIHVYCLAMYIIWHHRS